MVNGEPRPKMNIPNLAVRKSQANILPDEGDNVEHTYVEIANYTPCISSESVNQVSSL
jgi:hypothetical protein